MRYSYRKYILNEGKYDLNKHIDSKMIFPGVYNNLLLM